MGLSENRVYPQWNSHFNRDNDHWPLGLGVHYFQTHPYGMSTEIGHFPGFLINDEFWDDPDDPRAATIPRMWGPRSRAKLVHITPITMVYGTYMYL